MPDSRAYPQIRDQYVGAHLVRLNAKGFTLIEILIAFAIFSVVVILLYGTFDTTYKASREMEDAAESLRQVRWGFYHLARDLGMYYQAPKIKGREGEKHTLRFEVLDQYRFSDQAEWPNDTIKFKSVSHGRTIQNAAESDLIEVSYYLKDDALIRQAQLSNQKIIYNEVGKNLIGLNFRYWDLANLAWVDRWDMIEQKRPPSAVEVEIFLRDRIGGSARFTTIVEIPGGS